MTNTIIDRFSSASSDAVHEVQESARDGVCFCSCMGWKSSKRSPKLCKHITELIERGIVRAEDHKRADGGAPVAPTPVAVAAANTPIARSGAPKAMLAKDVAHAPRKPWGDPAWVAEVKLDGYRILNVTEGGTNHQYARSGNSHSDNVRTRWMRDLPLPDGTILDGEIVTGEQSGYHGAHRTDLLYVVFDVIAVGGVDMTGQPWTVRREAVELVCDGLHPRVMASRVLGVPDMATTEALWADGVEGVMLKRRDATYASGKRSWDWLKAKFATTYDVIIVDAEGECTSTSRQAAGWKNLRYGVWKDGAVQLVGQLGVTGPAAEMAAHVGKVAEVKAYGQNPDTGALRHPIFKAFRTDKPIEECTI